MVRALPSPQTSFALLAIVPAVAQEGGHYATDSAEYTITWQDRQDLPLPISDATASVVSDRIYVIGGCDSAYGNSNVGDFYACADLARHVLIYEPESDRWTTSAASMQVDRYRHAAAVVGSDIYVVGGRDLEDNVVRSVLRYSTTEDSWEMVCEFAEATSDNAAFEHDGNMVTCGGYYAADYSAASAECHILDPREAEPRFRPWAPSLVQGRGDFSIVKLGQWVYAYGGFSGYPGSALASLEKIDPSAPGEAARWISVQAAMVHGRGDFAAAVFNGRLLAIGGEDETDDVATAGASLRHVEAYDPAAGEQGAWLGPEQHMPLPHATFRFVGAAHGDKVFIFGGQGPLNATCDCYPTKSGVFAYHEEVAVLTDSSDGARAWAPSAAALLVGLAAAVVV